MNQSQLVKYEAACRALAECKAIDEVKVWADKAAAMQAYGRMAKDKTLEVDAAEIRIRAERRLGEMIALQKGLQGLAKPGPRSVVSNDRIPTLQDSGISKDLSSRAQKLAAVPAAEFEAEVGEWRDRVTQEGKRVSARLEQAGERAMDAAQVEDGAPSAEEIAAMEAEQEGELAAFQLLIGADDALGTALKEVKRQAALIRILEERLRGLQSSCNEYMRLVKMWRKKFEKVTGAAA